jgi:hypothetical protein
MAPKRVITGLILISALAATPALAADGQNRRRGSDRQQEERTERQAPPPAAVQRERAVPRFNNAEPRYNDHFRSDVRRDYDRSRWNPPHNNYRYGRTVIVPRIIRPRVVTVVPYRPYFYRPRVSLGLFYGSGGAYPYGYTPPGYFNPVPGRPYGGVRITGAPHDAQVFADGYYVGIADDFDGVFQHINLEAGAHHIEIEETGFEPIAFDVMVQPGQTVTFRADLVRY